MSTCAMRVQGVATKAAMKCGRAAGAATATDAGRRDEISLEIDGQRNRSALCSSSQRQPRLSHPWSSVQHWPSARQEQPQEKNAATAHCGARRCSQPSQHEQQPPSLVATTSPLRCHIATPCMRTMRSASCFSCAFSSAALMQSRRRIELSVDWRQPFAFSHRDELKCAEQRSEQPRLLHSRCISERVTFRSLLFAAFHRGE